jgi:hypothetical protein
MPELKDMTGLRFDRLTVTRHVGRDRHGYATSLLRGIRNSLPSVRREMM